MLVAAALGPAGAGGPSTAKRNCMMRKMPDRLAIAGSERSSAVSSDCRPLEDLISRSTRATRAMRRMRSRLVGKTWLGLGVRVGVRVRGGVRLGEG